VSQAQRRQFLIATGALLTAPPSILLRADRVIE
jgi:hypothetical protein